MPETAYLDVSLLPWRLRAHVMDPEALRSGMPMDGGFGVSGDVGGLVFGLAFWLFVFVAAPLLVLVIAALLFSVELPIVLALAVLLLIVRFAGVIPWTVVVIDGVSRAERRERYRNLFRALAHIRDVNGDRRVHVRWAWHAHPHD